MRVRLHHRIKLATRNFPHSHAQRINLLSQRLLTIAAMPSTISLLSKKYLKKAARIVANQLGDTIAPHNEISR
jgi:hypothetical protein